MLRTEGDRVRSRGGLRAVVTLAALFTFAQLAVPRPVLAQVPWESPMLLAPAAPSGLGIFFVDFGLSPNDGIGGLVTWRSEDAPGGVGLRLAVTRGRDQDDPRASGGLDFSVPMFSHSERFPLDVIWISGVGAAVGDFVQVAVPVGFAAGRAVEGPTIWFNPYLSTRVVFEAFIGDERPDDFDLALAADVGFDIAFDRGRDLVLRFGASLGDRHSFVAGFVVR